jgi:hypothetical protein
MWVSERFSSVQSLVDALNERRISAARCKIVVSRDDADHQVFDLLVQIDDGSELVMAATAEAEPLSADDREDAVDAAEAILAEDRRKD